MDKNKKEAIFDAIKKAVIKGVNIVLIKFEDKQQGCLKNSLLKAVNVGCYEAFWNKGSTAENPKIILEQYKSGTKKAA